jgi:Tol biopolymer transport system component
MKITKNISLIFFVFVVSCNKSNSRDDPVELTPTPAVFSIENTCVEFSKIVPENLELTGKLIVYNQHEKSLLNLADNTYLPFAGDVSPSGDKIAVYEYGKWLQITDLSNNVLITFPWNPRWIEANKILFGDLAEPDRLFYGWHDNYSIGISALPVGSLFILNTATSESREVTFPYSNEVYGIGFVGNIRDYFVSFSPDFDKVVYASTGSHLVLRNNSIHSDGTWRTVTWTGFSPTNSNPRWSPDGTTFVFVKEIKENTQSLFQVYADFTVGEAELIDLNNLFNSPYRASIGQFDWSPDGTKIALVAHVAQTEGGESFSRLLVLDIATGNIEDYCNPDPETPFSSSGSFSFTWSPDGKFIATDTTIVELESRIAYKIPDIYIVDWVGESQNR